MFGGTPARQNANTGRRCTTLYPWLVAVSLSAVFVVKTVVVMHADLYTQDCGASDRNTSRIEIVTYQSLDGLEI